MKLFLMNMVNELIFIEGRLNRKAFLRYLVALAIAYVIVYKICELLYNYNEHMGLLMCSLLWGGLTYILLIVHIKRLHDIDVSGWFVLLICILGPLLTLALIPVSGTIKENRFGNPPI